MGIVAMLGMPYQSLINLYLRDCAVIYTTSFLVNPSIRFWLKRVPAVTRTGHNG